MFLQRALEISPFDHTEGDTVKADPVNDPPKREGSHLVPLKLKYVRIEFSIALPQLRMVVFAPLGDVIDCGWIVRLHTTFRACALACALY